MAPDLLQPPSVYALKSYRAQEVEHMLRTTFAIGLTGVLVMAAGRSLAAGGKSAPMSLAGDYTIVAGEREGQKEPPEHIQGTAVSFTADTVTVTDKDKKETYVATYKIDAAKQPAVITMTEKTGPTKGENARGLIEKNGNMVKLIYALPGGDMPTGFAKTKDKQLMFVLKRNQ
jgi:uncharacterized protein (TIGR03067 family)